jgi:PAS domain S-box-containing protein
MSPSASPSPSLIPGTTMRGPRLTAVTRMLLIAAGYFLLAELSRSHWAIKGDAAPIWPAAGFAIGALVLFGLDLWPGVLLGTLLVPLMERQLVWVTALIAAGNTLAPVLGAWALRRRPGFRPALDRLGDVGALILLSACAAMAVTATIGTATVVWRDAWRFAHPLSVVSFWWSWWLSDVIGVLVIAPLMMVWLHGRHRWTRNALPEFLAAIAALLVVSVAIFATRVPLSVQGYPIAYLVVPVLMWGAVRFGQRGAVTLIATLAVAGVLLISVASGPFARAGVREGLILMQSYLGVMAATTLVLAAVIDDRARTQRDLRVHDERLWLALEGTDQGMYDWNVASGEVIRSAHLARLLGITPDELPGRIDAWKALIHPDDAPSVAQAIDDHLAGRTPLYESEHRLRAKNGQWVWIHDRGRIVERDADGRPLRVAGMHSDITARRRMAEERQRLDAQLQHAQRLDSLGVLAGGVAHDFNNLLVGILGNASLASSDLPPESPVQETLHHIETSAIRAAELTRQMLAFSGKGRFVVEALDLSRVVNGIRQLVSTVVSKKAELRYDLGAGLPQVEADAGQVRQLVMNLVANASDALAGESGDISVRTGDMFADRAYLAATVIDEQLAPGDYVFLEVSDTGVGMDRETQERIFDPFFSTKFVGRGLGLAAVLGIVRGHHGAIAVRSSPGHGTVIRVLFPASGSDRVADHPAKGAEPVDQRAVPRILVADDEAGVLGVARRALERGGYTVLTAADGLAALEIARQDPDGIDGVLVDATMPRMSGDELVRALRRLRPDLPVILTSGYSEEDAMRRFDGLGLSGFLQKPFQPADLVAKFAAALRPAR